MISSRSYPKPAPAGAALLVALVLAYACDGDNPVDPVDPLDVRVFPADVFAGGEVFLAGDWYRDSTRVFALSVDTFNLAVRRVDDSTIAAMLPSTENGSFQLVERINSADVDRGAVEVHGLKHFASIQIPVEGEFTPSRNPALPYVVTGDSAGVSVVDVRNDLATRYPGLGKVRYEGSGCHRIAGPSYRDGTFLIFDTVPFPARQATRWQLIPDTLRGQALFPYGCGMAEVSPQVFVQTGSEGAAAFVTLDSIDDVGNFVHFYSDTIIGNKGFFWSGNRLVLGGLNHSGTGVIDLENRGLAYRVPSINSVESAAFSVDGQSIALCGETSQGEDALVSVNALTGDSLQGIPMACQSLAIDPELGLLYAVVPDNNDIFPPVSVVVLEPATLAQVGKIVLPAGVCIYCISRSVMIVDRAFSELIVLYQNLAGGVGLAHLSLPAAP